MRFVQALGLAILLAAVAAPVVAQTDTDLCLRVQAAPDVDLADAEAVQEGIGTGQILVSEVVPCGAATAPSASPVSDVGTGAWNIPPIEVDPLTQDQEALVSLAAEEGTKSTGQPIELVIRCADGSTELSVSWSWNLGPEELIDVDKRIGDGEVTTDRWFRIGEATSWGGSDTAFIKSLFGQTRLVLRLETDHEGPRIAVFDISGTENAVANVREACGW